MGEYLQEAVLPVQYDNYVFDLYGTLVDIHTEEDFPKLWEKLALFFGYYGAIYEPKELQKRYAALVSDCERALKKTLEEDRHYTHGASPEIEIGEVFEKLYQEKGIVADKTCHTYWTVFPCAVYRLCPFVSGDTADACQSEKNGQKSVSVIECPAHFYRI